MFMNKLQVGHIVTNQVTRKKQDQNTPDRNWAICSEHIHRDFLSLQATLKNLILMDLTRKVRATFKQNMLCEWFKGHT